MKVSMLTTKDNPYDPFDDFDRWSVFDHQHGYYSSELLARICKASPDLSWELYNEEITAAIDEIVEKNISGVHMKVTREFSAP